MPAADGMTIAVSLAVMPMRMPECGALRPPAGTSEVLDFANIMYRPVGILLEGIG